MVKRLLHAKALALVIGLFIVLRGLILFPAEPMLAGILLLGVGLLNGMIWASDWVAEHMLRGRMAHLASDYDQASAQGPVVALFAWLLLLILLAFMLFSSAHDEAALSLLNLSCWIA